MKLLNPWMILAVILAVGGAFGGGTALGVKYQKGQTAREEVLIAKAADAAQVATAKEIAKIEIKQTTIKQRVEQTIREVPAYRECVNDPAVERLLDDARANRDPQPASGGVVSGPGVDPAP